MFGRCIIDMGHARNMSETMIATRIGVTVSSRVAAEGIGGGVELSIVMPCLNEADTRILGGLCGEGVCGRHAKGDFRISEVVVADNGSTDGSQEIARKLGARVVAVAAKGYGNALMGGIAAARGRYILMGDADDSYDFLEAPKFLERLREGRALVQGCRLPGGGGTIRPGAMPFLHRWWGNPMFSLMARWMFKRLRFTMCIAGCGDLRRICMSDSICAARGWNLRRR